MTFAFGYYKNVSFVCFEVLWKQVLPISVIIITTEIVRSVLLAQNNKLVSAITYFSCVFAELLTVSGVYEITSFNRFMDFVGLTLVPAISANVLYHYVSQRFGMWPCVSYRAIITLSGYFVPTVSAMSDSLTAVVKLALSIVVLSAVVALYDDKKRPAKEKKNRFAFVWTLAGALLSISIVMLSSCQFRFGALVIATESMTGEINKGDVVIVEMYRDQDLSVGQIIAFDMRGATTVHRIIGIERIDGETRYYTKGDANESPDIGYITEENIVSITKFKLAYFGFPTLWLQSLFGK